MSRLILFIKNNFFIIILLSFSLIIYHKWFFDYSILTYNDFIFKYSESLKELPITPQTWSSNYNLGNVYQAPFTYPVDLLNSILVKIGFPWNITERILYMWPIAIIAPISSFLLIRKIIISKSGAFLGALFFTFNSYFLAAFQNGHLSLMVAYILSPFFILSFLKLYEKRLFINFIFVSIIGFVISVYDFRILFSLIWISFIYFIFDLLINHYNFKIKISVYNFFILIGPVLIIFLLNSYWLYPFFFHKSGYSIEAITRGVLRNDFTILNSLTLGYPLRYLGIDDFNFRNIPIYFGLIPIFGFLGLLLNRKNKLVLFFGILTLIGIFLGKQTANPFPNLYYWFFNHVPGFNGFREASKFYFIIAIGYSVLIGAFARWILNNLNNNILQSYLKYIIILGIIFVSLWNTRLIFSGELGSIFISSKIPEDYLTFKNFVLKQPEYFSVLWVPNPSMWSIYTNNHSLDGLDSLVQDWAWNDKISNEYLNNNNPYKYELVHILNQLYSDRLIDLASIKYVVVPLDDPQKKELYYNIFDLYGDRKFFIKSLDKLTYLHKLNIGTKELVVYENNDFRPLIYTTQEKETIYKYIPYQNVSYLFKYPTKYEINLNNISKPVYLNFSQTYNSEWELWIGKFNWFKVLLDKNYFGENNHLKNDSNLNSFLINPEYIKQNFSKEYYNENPDGSIDLKLVLYFKTQSYFYLGLIISGTTLLGCIGYLIYEGIKHLKLIKSNAIK